MGRSGRRRRRRVRELAGGGGFVAEELTDGGGEPVALGTYATREEAARRLRREHQRDYVRRSPERARAARRAARAKQLVEDPEYFARYRAAHRERIRANWRRWYQQRRERRRLTEAAA
jgi:hypothetical protein